MARFEGAPVTYEDDAAHDERPAAGIAAAGASRAGEQRLQRELGRVPNGLVMISLDAGRPNPCLAVNDAYCELTGYSPRELDGRDFLGDIHPEDQPALETLIQDVRSGAVSLIQADARLVRKDGEIVYGRLTGSVIGPPAGERCLATFIEDTSAAERTRAEIHRLQRELQRSRRLASLGQLVGGISHDFSNMLTVIANYASLIRDEVIVAEATESAARWGPVRWDVEQIEDSADRARRLIKHLLAFARREEAEPVLVDAGQTVSDVTGLLGEVLGEDVPVVTRGGEGLWPVEADRSQLEQVIVSIALNARDAMPGGGQVTIETANIDLANYAAGPQDAADLAELLPGRYVGLRISDNGAGMDAPTAEQAFEPFFTTKSGDQAAGLGLATVRRFAAQAGGKAWLRSEPGKGTTVTVMLPAAAQSGAAPAGHQGWAAEHTATVLVVDDDAAIRNVAHRVLASAGYRVMTAADGQEALGLLGDPEKAVALVLTDVVMPGMTGKAFAAQAQAVRPGIAVLFMSGYDRQGHAEGWPAPETQVIGKPFTRAALLARVTRALADGAGEDTSAEQCSPRGSGASKRWLAGRELPGGSATSF
jgi:two-component system, cell cycle sensor histidine kinase and response regulator CckA